MTPTMLTLELLARYESRLRDSGLSVVDRLRPGLHDREIEDRMRPLGLRLPIEARVWFGWHDGADKAGFEVEIAPSFEVMSLDEAIAWYQMKLGHAQRVAQEWDRPLEENWQPEWFPLVRAYATIACDCSVPEGAPTPIRAIDPPTDPEWREPRAASLGDMIELWIRSWDTGAWYAELERDIPQRRHQQPDQHGRRHPLLDV